VPTQIYVTYFSAKSPPSSQVPSAKHLQTLQKEFAALAKLPKCPYLSECLALHFVGAATNARPKEKVDKQVYMPTTVYHVQSHWPRAVNVASTGSMPLSNLVQLATCTLRALNALHTKDVLHKSLHTDCIYQIDDASRQFAITDYVVRCGRVVSSHWSFFILNVLFLEVEWWKSQIYSPLTLVMVTTE
jgi:hypothetical protein